MTPHCVLNKLGLLLAALTVNANVVPRQASGSGGGGGVGAGATLSTADPTGGGGVYGPGATAAAPAPTTSASVTGAAGSSATERLGLSTADPTGGGGVFGPGATDPNPISRSTSRQLFPTGTRDGSGTFEATLPLVCTEHCTAPARVYYACFIDPSNSQTNQTVSQELCDDYLCQPDNYQHLVACLNCIVANGDERPYGFHTNSSITAVSTLPPALSAAGVELNPNGPVNAEQARSWLRNVTERCDSVGRGLGDSGGADKLTAVPTTTGPYYKSWSSGEVVTLTTWTGLAQYTTISLPSLYANSTSGESASGASGAPAASGSQSAGGGAPSGAAGLSRQMPSVGGWLLSALISWAVL